MRRHNRFSRRVLMTAARFFALAMTVGCAGPALAWDQEGHSIVAEIAQRRLNAAAAQAVEQVLGRGYSLASVASWADDVRETAPETYNWHFVDMPIGSSQYDPATQCAPDPKGDCVVAELDRLKNELRCVGCAETRGAEIRRAFRRRHPSAAAHGARGSGRQRHSRGRQHERAHL